MRKRAAIYARFSSDRQVVRSIDDQVALCQALADRNSWAVAMIYADFAASGSTVHRRPEFSRMLTHAEDHQFDIIIAEDINRLARGEGDAPKLRQRLEFLGIEMHTCTDGHITKLHAGLKGLMSSLFLDNLIAHTKRGMAGVVRDAPARQNIRLQNDRGPPRRARDCRGRSRNRAAHFRALSCR